MRDADAEDPESRGFRPPIDLAGLGFAITRTAGVELRIIGEFERGANGAFEAIMSGDRRVVLKVVDDVDAEQKMAFCATYLPMLKERGYPVPDLAAHGPLGDGMWFSLFGYLEGEPPNELDAQLFEQLEDLVQLQADARIDAPHRNWSWWVRETFFENHLDWFERAHAASESSAELMDSLRNFAKGSRSHEMHADDFVHGDFGPHNVIVSDGRISGVLDWMNFGIGNRAIDLGGLLVSLQLLRDEGRPVPVDGGARLVNLMVELAGDEGLVQIVGYHLMAGIAFWGSKRASDIVERWVRAGGRIVEDLMDRSFG